MSKISKDVNLVKSVLFSSNNYCVVYVKDRLSIVKFGISEEESNKLAKSKNEEYKRNHPGYKGPGMYIAMTLDDYENERGAMMEELYPIDEEDRYHWERNKSFR